MRKLILGLLIFLAPFFSFGSPLGAATLKLRSVYERVCNLPSLIRGAQLRGNAGRLLRAAAAEPAKDQIPDEFRPHYSLRKSQENRFRLELVELTTGMVLSDDGSNLVAHFSRNGSSKLREEVRVSLPSEYEEGKEGAALAHSLQGEVIPVLFKDTIRQLRRYFWETFLGQRADPTKEIAPGNLRYVGTFSWIVTDFEKLKCLQESEFATVANGLVLEVGGAGFDHTITISIENGTFEVTLITRYLSQWEKRKDASTFIRLPLSFAFDREGGIREDFLSSVAEASINNYYK
jgi:hypothetical protein